LQTALLYSIEVSIDWK